jgi:large subunit ribosomal protein L4
MPAQMRRAALRGVLSAKRAEGAVRVITGIELPEINTRAFVDRLRAWKAEGKVLMVLPARDEVAERSCRNLREVRVVLADSLNVIDLLEADTVVFTQAALERAQEVYG